MKHVCEHNPSLQGSNLLAFVMGITSQKNTLLDQVGLHISRFVYLPVPPQNNVCICLNLEKPPENRVAPKPFRIRKFHIYGICFSSACESRVPWGIILSIFI